MDNYSRIQGRLGDRGYSIVLVYLEVTDGSTPDLPSGGETTDGILTTLPPGGWVYSAPTNPTGIIWIAQGFVGQTVSPTWRSRFPVQGSTANGISTDIVYLRSDTTPATPSGGTALNGELTVAPSGGWALDKPTGTAPLWIAFVHISDDTINGYETPIRHPEEVPFAGFNWYFAYGIPSNSLGSDYDFYTNLTDQSIWLKQNGLWGRKHLGVKNFANPNLSTKVNTSDIADLAITSALIQESDGAHPTLGIQRSNLAYHLQNAIMTIRHRSDAFTFLASGLVLETNDDETIIYGLFLADASIHYAIAANVAITENQNIRRIRMTSDTLNSQDFLTPHIRSISNRVVQLEHKTALQRTITNRGSNEQATGNVLSISSTEATVNSITGLTYTNTLAHISTNTAQFIKVKIPENTDPYEASIHMLEDMGGGLQSLAHLSSFEEVVTHNSFTYYQGHLPFGLTIAGTISLRINVSDITEVESKNTRSSVGELLATSSTLTPRAQ